MFDIGVEIGDAHAQITALEVLAKVTEGRVTAIQTQAALGRRGDDIEVTVAALLAEALRLRHAGQLEQAIESLSSAARLVSRAQPTSTHLVPVFAWLATLHREAAERPLLPHIRRERLRRARKSARRAVRYGKLYPNDLPHALRELGVVCALSGHRRRARRYLKRSAAWARRREASAELAETNLQSARLELTGEVPGGEGYPELGLGAARSALSTLGLAERFAALLEAGVLLASSDSAEATVRAIRETTQTLLRAERCRVVGLTTDWRPGHSAASAEEQEAARRAAEHRGPLVLNRPLATELEPDAELALPDARSALCAPVFVRDEMVGYFLALHSQVGKLFGEEEQQLAEFVARLAGAALERQQLQRDIRARVISAQEAERSRVARDLHDEVGQALTSVLLGVRLVESTVSNDSSGSVKPSDVLPRVAELRHHVAGALGSVQRLAFDLRPTVLDDLGLVAALRRLTASAVTGDVCVELETVNLEPGDRLSAEIETTTYRVVQEAVTNVARHSRASKCSVVIGRTQRCLRVVIEDDGIGFRTDALSGGGLGLLGMKERAALVGGTLRVTSAPGQGTAISLEVPLDE
ncbi:GAF domain-containing sensor histidine kinase [Protofrankia sp. BMG5.30]|uniref:GAF domain-containing sensor histidine kinase n=1 Tax=Protofrankia sp. BMG5.30 TaxID=1834514 RepID=UPI00158EF9F0|nr:GAF domain-containing sensor histidine kinase [Protofrankia sp. BMG5.30]